MKVSRIKRSDRYKNPGVLIGIRSICGYTRISPHTLHKWTAQHDFPAVRVPGGRWCTSKSLIDDWITARWKRQAGREAFKCHTHSEGSGA